MSTVPVQEQTTNATSTQVKGVHNNMRIYYFLRSNVSKHVILLILSALLFFGPLALSMNQPAAHAANPGAGNSCSWYRVQYGNTLSSIAWRYHTTIWTLAQVNSIRNVNLIFVGQELCIPYRQNGGSSWGNGGGGGTSGIMSNGIVRWYDYSALNWSSQGEIRALLYQAAAHYGLPANLLMAIAWQESGWNQHVIAWDGGIGVMQLMPYTAMSLNASTHFRRDPYHLVDNIYLGATYLDYLWHNFHGNLPEVISAYNEGGWAVVHRGIFNWRYVNNVLALMNRF
jgi:hypothetical protein